MASKNVVELTDDNFETEVLAEGTTALVDFWAEWCMPCRMLAPMVDEIADEYVDRLKVGKVDTDANREISMKFNINAIPTLILLKDGQMVKKFVGMQPKRELKAAIDEVLG